MCIECHIWVDMYYVSAQGIDEHAINVHYYYYDCLGVNARPVVRVDHSLEE